MTRRALKQRQCEAFNALVSAYEACLLRYAARLTANPSSAEDIVQEAFLKLLRHWTGSLTPSPQLKAWLYRVVHNEAVDHVRREARRANAHNRDAETQPSAAEPDRGAAGRISDRAHDAAQALERLTPRERDLVILKVYEGRSYREIGDLKGLSIGNVGFILHRAMRKLAAYLDEKHVD